MTKRTTGEGPNPSGLCMCGCGERTNLAPQSDKYRGWILGKPVRFIAGHSSRLSPIEYIVDPDTGCWIWQRYTDPSGYGRYPGIRDENGRQKARYAHRVYYERANGPIPDGLHIDHLCRRRNCVNPAHLEAVTPGENLRRGEGFRLTLEDAKAIQAMLRDGKSMASIARHFGVSAGCISEIKRGRNWKDSAPSV